MDYDVIVVGVGAMGAAVLEQLSRRGVSALGIERHSLPNARGSSGGDTRLVRKAYFEHPDYVPLLERAYRNWRDIEGRSGERLLFETGALYIGPSDGDLIAGSLGAARAHGLAVEELSGSEVARRYPEFLVPDGHAALLEPEAGFVMSTRSIATLASLALNQGARLLTHTRVDDWKADSNGVEVVTSAGRFAAARLVLTGGSWSPQLLKLRGLELSVTRQPLFWIQPSEPERFVLGRFPCWAIQSGAHGGVFYGFPGAVPGAAQLGVKFAHHFPGAGCDPDTARSDPDHGEYRALRDAVAPFIPGLDGTLLAASTCMYTMSADQHFVVDRHPDHDGVVFGAGFSGHGFKFAAVMGELLADYALEDHSELPAGFLRMGDRNLQVPFGRAS